MKAKALEFTMQLASCKQLDVVGFKAVKAPKPITDESDYNGYQKYLLKVFNGVRSGSLSSHLALQKPVPSNHS